MSEWPDTYCRTCGAKPGEPCITSAGNRAHKPHGQRGSVSSKRKHPSASAISSNARQLVGRRSGGRCEFITVGIRCESRAVHVHHRRLRSQGGTDNPVNLIHFCSSHHDFVHKYPEWSYEHGYLERTEAR